MKSIRHEKLRRRKKIGLRSSPPLVHHPEFTAKVVRTSRKRFDPDPVMEGICEHLREKYDYLTVQISQCIIEIYAPGRTNRRCSMVHHEATMVVSFAGGHQNPCNPRGKPAICHTLGLAHPEFLDHLYKLLDEVFGFLEP